MIEIGGLPIAVQTTDPEFERLLRQRYCDYIRPSSVPQFALSVQIVAPDLMDPDADVEVWLVEGHEWRMARGDFRASWNPAERWGQIQQCANPYSIDSVLRIIHTLMLAPDGGFLLHASSVVRNGKAFLFSGISEAGKTTIARLAPPDAEVLTDEASYIRKIDGRYVAYGTPFAGEFGEPGKNIRAPIAALYLLKKAPENSIEKINPTDATQRLLRNILFFAQQDELVRQVFDAACAFVASVPIYQLSFFPDQRVWEVIG
ncbi:MAG TPA: hypothetical protein VMU43_09985 [Candidatus Acidoferrum sp.]|nr:hypothetical protein [Candidatus Acidoferrum sp.]